MARRRLFSTHHRIPQATHEHRVEFINHHAADLSDVLSQAQYTRKQGYGLYRREGMLSSIVVADRDWYIRASVRMALTDAGFDTLEVTECDLLLAILRLTDRPLIVLLDMTLPTANGETAWEHLEHHPQILRCHTIVGLSADALPATRLTRRGNGQKAIPLVRKPIDRPALVALLSHLAQTGVGAHRRAQR
jgi:CheY-like chemotaxis protein